MGYPVGGVADAWEVDSTALPPPLGRLEIVSAQRCLAALQARPGRSFRGTVLNCPPDPLTTLRSHYRLLAVAQGLAREASLRTPVRRHLARLALPGDLLLRLLDEIGPKPAEVEPIGPEAPQSGVFSPSRRPPPDGEPLGYQSRPTRVLRSMLRYGNPEAFVLCDAGLELLAGVLEDAAVPWQARPDPAWQCAALRALERLIALELMPQLRPPDRPPQGVGAVVPTVLQRCLQGMNATSLSDAEVRESLARLLWRLELFPNEIHFGDPATPLTADLPFAATWEKVDCLCLGAAAPVPRRHGVSGVANPTVEVLALPATATAAQRAAALIDDVYNPSLDLHHLVVVGIGVGAKNSMVRLDLAALHEESARQFFAALVTGTAHLGLASVLCGLYLRGDTALLADNLKAMGYTAAQARTWSHTAAQLQELSGDRLFMALAPLEGAIPDYRLLPLRTALAGLSRIEFNTVEALFVAHQQVDPQNAARALIDRAELCPLGEERATIGRVLAQADLSRVDLHAAVAGGRHRTVYAEETEEVRTCAAATLQEPLQDDKVVALGHCLLTHSAKAPLSIWMDEALAHIDANAPCKVASLGQVAQAPQTPVGQPWGPGATVQAFGTKLHINDAPYRQMGRIPPPDALCMTPTTQNCLALLATQWRCRNPVLLEGPTGVGKQAMVAHLCHLTKSPLFTMALSEDTESGDLLGRLVPGSLVFTPAALAALTAAELAELARQFEVTDPERSHQIEQILLRQMEPHWVDGPVVQAARRGEAILLQNINLARPEEIECLNSLLDGDRNLVLTAKGGEVVVPQPQFRLLATQNPSSYAGRVKLSGAFASRWAKLPCPQLTDADLLEILRRHLDDSQAEVRTALLAAHQNLLQAAAAGSIGRGLGGATFSLRELLRVVNRFIAYRGRDLEDAALMQRECREVYGGVVLGDSEGRAFEAILAQVWPQQVRFYDNLQLCETPEAYFLGDLRIKRHHSGHPAVPQIGSQLCLTKRTLEGLYKLCKVVLADGENALLVGERAAGKGVLVRYLAHLLGLPYYRQTISEQTDTIELLGGYSTSGWRDGLILQAMRAEHVPGVLLLDELNVGQPGLIERLDDLLGQRRLLLHEKEGGEEVRLHPEARLVCAINPPSAAYGGRKALSVALLNRMTPIVLLPLDDADELREIAHFVGSRRGVPEPMLAALVDLHVWSRARQVEAHCDWTRRAAQTELSVRTLEWAIEVMAELWEEMGAYEVFMQVASLFYVPALGANESEAVLDQARALADQEAQP